MNFLATYERSPKAIANDQTLPARAAHSACIGLTLSTETNDKTTRAVAVDRWLTEKPPDMSIFIKVSPGRLKSF